MNASPASACSIHSTRTTAACSRPRTLFLHPVLAWRPVLQVNQKLQLFAQGKWVDEEPEERRSPSPEPVYNEQGARTNTREQRAKDKLVRQRNVSATAGVCSTATARAHQHQHSMHAAAGQRQTYAGTQCEQRGCCDKAGVSSAQ